MISENDKKIIVRQAQKYNLKKVILFGSSKEQSSSNDIDIGIEGLAPKLFFKFYWELYRDLSKPLDLVDLEMDSLFVQIIKEDGLVIYG